ncbi:Gfo/Idh/MocA family protein [Verrucomicrobiota bacterium]
MIKVAIVGTGNMAHGHANSFGKIRGCRLAAACDVDRKRAEAFARRFKIPEVYDNVDDMLSNAEIDAVSNVTPDPHHAPVSLKVIAAGKHILCEKPLATGYADARKMAHAAGRKRVINMVNLSYRDSSAIQKARQLIEQGDLGKIVHVEARYLQSWLVSNAWGDWRASPRWLWRLSRKHGSKGVLGDLGVHIIDFATFPVGDVKSVNGRLRTFPKARGDRIGEYKLDANDSAIMTVEFSNGAIGTISTTRWATGHLNSVKLRIYGDQGGLVVDLDESYDALRICRGRDVNPAKWKTIRCGKTPSIYQRFIRSIKTGHNDQPDFARGAVVQKIMDACVESDKTGAAVRL